MSCPARSSHPAPARGDRRGAARRSVRGGATLGLTLALGSVLTGCGEADLDEDQQEAEQVSRTYLEAVVAEDADAACRVMSINDRAVTDDPAWLAACVQGIEESNTSQERRDAYRRQLDAGAKVGEVEDGEVTVTWGRGDDVTALTVVEIDGKWLLTQ